MKLSVTYSFLIIILFAFSSCNILKTKENIATDENESKFIYLFSEANKNRLSGNKTKAIELYLSAVDIKPKSAASYFYLSVIFLSEKENITALKFAEKAVILQPDNFWYNIVNADILSSVNKKNALDIYEKLIKEYPKKELLYDRLIRIYSTEKDFDNLLRTYERKLKYIQYDNDIALSLYHLSLKQGNNKKAEEVLSELIKNNSDNPKYKTLLAEYYFSIHEMLKAETLFNDLIEKYPNNSEVRLSYTYFCKYTQKKEKYFENVLLLTGSDLNINEKINLLISGQYPNFPEEQYAELLGELYRHHPENIVVNTLVAEYYIEKGNKEKAIKYVRKATELSKSDFNLMLILFELSYDVKKFEDLYKDSEKYLNLYPNRPKIFLYNGIAAYEINKFDKAISALETGMDLVIENNELLVQFYYYLAESFHKTKDHKNSDKYFEKILKNESKFYPAIVSYSIYLSERKENLAKAEILAKQCIKNDNNNSFYYYAYSLALLKAEKYDDALIISEKYITENIKNVDYLELHGDILFSNHKSKEALEYWNLSKKGGNDDEHLIYKIKKGDKLKLNEL